MKQRIAIEILLSFIPKAKTPTPTLNCDRNQFGIKSDLDLQVLKKTKSSTNIRLAKNKFVFDETRTNNIKEGALMLTKIGSLLNQKYLRSRYLTEV